MVCRQIYAKTKVLLYKNSTFNIVRQDAAERIFLRMLPWQRDAIPSLKFMYDFSECATEAQCLIGAERLIGDGAVREFKGVRKVIVALHGDNDDCPDEEYRVRAKIQDCMKVAYGDDVEVDMFWEFWSYGRDMMIRTLRHPRRSETFTSADA